VGNITEWLFTDDIPALICWLLSEREVSREDMDALEAMNAARERERLSFPPLAADTPLPHRSSRALDNRKEPCRRLN